MYRLTLNTYPKAWIMYRQASKHPNVNSFLRNSMNDSTFSQDALDKALREVAKTKREFETIESIADAVRSEYRFFKR